MDLGDCMYVAGTGVNIPYMTCIKDHFDRKADSIIIYYFIRLVLIATYRNMM